MRADELSRFKRKCSMDMEWAMQQSIYDKIADKMGKCDIDLFASRQNHKVATFNIICATERSCFCKCIFGIMEI